MLAVNNEPRLSSPLTPQSSSSVSPNATPSDASLELSFDYEFDSHGNFIRVSKGSTTSLDTSADSSPKDFRESPSPASQPALRRVSLSRSESAPSAAAMEAANPPTALRSFHRVTSGPALTPGSRGTLAPSRKLGPPQRVPIDAAENKFRMGEQSKPSEEKENIVNSRQVASGSRIGRPVKRYASGVSVSDVPDADTLRGSQRRVDLNDDTSGDEQGKNSTRPRYAAVPITASSSLSSSTGTGTRHRRSASLSDASSPFSLCCS
jgi:hypothetical protein